jgi:hypothetical protein
VLLSYAVASFFPLWLLKSFSLAPEWLMPAVYAHALFLPLSTCM